MKNRESALYLEGKLLIEKIYKALNGMIPPLKSPEFG